MRILTAILLVLAETTTASAGVVCKNGSVAPAVIRRAAAGLPTSARVPMAVGATLRPSIHTAPLPKVLGQILPQYPGYRAVRTRKTVAIVDPRTRHIAYLLPLYLAQPLDCPDS